MTLQLYGLNFHLYGLILGLAVSVGVLVAEYLAKKEDISESVFWKTVIPTVICGVLGARLYHVWTDWSLYQNNLVDALKIWQGGLSIIGAFLGGCVGIVVSTLLVRSEIKQQKIKTTKSHVFLQFVDIAALCLPLSQVIGRWANFFNQELYGWPTDLPWGINIDPIYRVKGYESFEKFHPLFFYEALGMSVCAVILWVLYKKKIWKVGQGNFALFYFSWYGVFRAGLEFLRIEKSYFFETGVGLNQLLLFIVGLSCMITLLYRLSIFRKSSTSLQVGLILLVTMVIFSGCQPKSQPSSSEVSQTQYKRLLEMRDYTPRTIRFTHQGTSQKQDLQVEVVTSRQALAKGLGGRDVLGKDGMLFVFADKAKHGIWMKNMKFDLDIVWMSEGKIVGITPLVKDPEGDNPGPSYYPPESVELVLEVPAGMTTTWQLQVGDSFDLL